jgi:hypothetical protein
VHGFFAANDFIRSIRALDTGLPEHRLNEKRWQ